MRSLLVLLAVVAVSVAFVMPLRTNVAGCEMCKVAVKVAAPTIGKDTQNVEKDFIAECEKVVPGEVGKIECKKFAKKELGAIIKELESGTAPDQVCKNLKYC